MIDPLLDHLLTLTVQGREWSNPILRGQVVVGDSRRALSQVFIGHSEPVRQVAFTPDQQHVISVGDAIFLWDFLAPPPVRSSPAR